MNMQLTKNRELDRRSKRARVLEAMVCEFGSDVKKIVGTTGKHSLGEACLMLLPLLTLEVIAVDGKDLSLADLIDMRCQFTKNPDVVKSDLTDGFIIGRVAIAILKVLSKCSYKFISSKIEVDLNAYINGIVKLLESKILLITFCFQGDFSMMELERRLIGVGADLSLSEKEMDHKSSVDKCKTIYGHGRVSYTALAELLMWPELHYCEV